MSLSTTKKTMISMAVAAACGCAAWPALAQQDGGAAPAAGAQDKKNEIPEVVVTATRHSTSLLKTPVSMTAVTQDELTRKGITDIRGLSGEVPNLQLGSATDGSSGVKISMRGVSSNDFTEIGNPAVIMAMRQGASGMTCPGNTATDIPESMNYMVDKLRNMPHATQNGNADFTSSGSVAGTAWLYYANQGKNPYAHY